MRMRIVKLFFVVLLLAGCEKSTSTNIVNDKLINGYSYPVEGGISSYYLIDEVNVITFYNVKSNNLFSICSGVVKSVSVDKIEINCSSKEVVSYVDYDYAFVYEGEDVFAGEKIADLPETTRSAVKRYRSNIIFSVGDKTLTNTEFFDYIKTKKE